MDEATAKKSMSFETLVIQNMTNINDLKAKLNNIIESGPGYEYDVSSCLKSLINSNDQDIALLTVQAISELAKCEDKREIYANEDIVLPIMHILHKDFTSDRFELIKQCLRAIGNLCCDNDTSRNIILEQGGVKSLKEVLEKSLPSLLPEVLDLKLCTLKLLLNFVIGGQEYCEAVIEAGVPGVIQTLLQNEVQSDDINDEVVINAILILSVMGDHNPQHVFEDTVNLMVKKMLAVTTNMELSEICLEFLHAQAEHDSVKTLLAKNDCVQLVFNRLQELVELHAAGGLKSDDEKVDEVMKRACDLAIIILTGDEAMHYLYKEGNGEAYRTVVQWMNSSNQHLLTTALLAIGNFARTEDYCRQMMGERVFDRLLDILEVHLNLEQRMAEQPKDTYLYDKPCVLRIQHASLSAVRNILVPPANKKKAAEDGRAIELFLRALPHAQDAHVAFKLLAATRMLVHGQGDAARRVLGDAAAAAGVVRASGLAAPAAEEARRLLAACVLRAPAPQVQGCISAIVSMLLSVHSIMQNEALLALTLLAQRSLAAQDPSAAATYIDQLVTAEIGKHVSVLVETNCAKMPAEGAENMAAFLDLTARTNKIALDYKAARVDDSLKKFLDLRTELKEGVKRVLLQVIIAISDYSQSK